MIVTKFLRLLAYEPPFLLRAALVLGLLIIWGVETKALRAQAGQWQKIKTEKDLVLRIPQMEDTIRAHTIMVLAAMAEQQPRPQVQIAKIEFNLQGTSIQHGIPYALIDKRIYKIGDRLGGFTVMEIARGSVVLLNQTTKEEKILKLPIPQNVPGITPGPALSTISTP